MRLDKYTEGFTTNETLQVVICVMQKSMDFADDSPVNWMLEKLQLDLRQEWEKRCKEVCECGSSAVERKKLEEEWKEKNPLELAFVYGAPYVQAVDFFRVKEDSPIYFKEPVRFDQTRGDETQRLSQLWFMSLAMLEAQRRKAEEESCSVRSRLYLITEADIAKPEEYNRILRILPGGEPELHPRFRLLPFEPYLWKKKGVRVGPLEEYIKKYGKVEEREKPKSGNRVF